ncbi:MAG: hypothetical protein JWR82_1713 [Blastococcus sp.]|jgi:hypothetical protein|nr:hypothetical protein [Blastococcus sp.]
MNTSTVPRSAPAGLSHPGAAAAIGVLTFGLTLGAGEIFELNANPDDEVGLSGLAIYVGLAAVGAAIAVAVGMWAWRSDLPRLAKAALGLAVGAAVTFVAFWSGWPIIFGAVAVGLAAEHRRRVGSFSGMTMVAMVLGALAFAAGAYICVVG